MTIDEAEADGWEGLYVYCGCQVRNLSWALLRHRAKDKEDLRVLAQRLRCENCRRSPRSALLTREVASIGGPKPIRAPIPEPPPPLSTL